MNQGLNALNPVSNINSFIEYFTNHGYSIRPELFYDKQLLDTIRLDESHFMFYRLADVSPIQGNAEKLQIRRWAPLQGHTVPLVEGVPPMSDKGSMEEYTIDTHSYGRYMEFTDRVNFEMIDPVVAHYTKEYAIVAMETLDLLAREALTSAAHAFYAGAVADFSELTLESTPDLTDLRIIALSMKKQLVKPRNGGKYHVIGTPDFYFDMINDELVEKYMTINQSTKGFYEDMGPIPSMFGLEFYETMHIDDSGESSGQLRVYNPTTKEYRTLDAETNKVAAESNYVLDSRTNKPASYIPDRKVWKIPEGFEELKVHRIFVIGAECLLRTEIAGHGNAKMYVKALGSAGVLDPIDQRQSIGFKIDSVGFGVPRAEAVVCYYCVPTQANINLV